jgi:hypothetical protein
MWKLPEEEQSADQQKTLAVINPVLWYHMIRIKGMILWVLPDLSQRVYLRDKSCNNAMNVT